MTYSASADQRLSGSKSKVRSILKIKKRFCGRRNDDYLVSNNDQLLADYWRETFSLKHSNQHTSMKLCSLSPCTVYKTYLPVSMKVVINKDCFFLDDF